MTSSSSKISIPTRFLLAAFALLFFIYACISWYFSSQILVAARDADKITEILQINNQSKTQPTILNVFDGDASANTLWLFTDSPKPSCVIILIHGWGADRLDLDKFKRPFEMTPCAMATYDIRAHGTDINKYSTGGIREKHDLLTIHRFLKTTFNLNDNNIGWFGVSLGGSTALQAAALDISPAFVIADSPFQDWQSAIFERGEDMYGSWVHAFKAGVNLAIYLRASIWFEEASVLATAQNIRSPVLLIHSKSDIDTASSQSEAIFSLLNSETIRFHQTDWGAGHAKDIDVQPEKYNALILQFLNDFVPKMHTQ